MSSDSGVRTGGGIGLPGLLMVLFVGLKLTGYIDWSWWWVLSPCWISLALLMAGLGLLVIMTVIANWND